MAMTAPGVDASLAGRDAVVLGSAPAGAVPGSDATLLGGKGASLARLIDAHLPVPESAVVTTAAYRRAAGLSTVRRILDRIGGPNPPTDPEIEAVFTEAELDPSTVAAIIAAASEIADDGPIAVRSSATVEDLGGASFAGQYQSFLDIDSSDPSAVLHAVKRVWASLWFDAPSAYRRAFGLEGGPIEMAVVLMRMVPADHAGVVFTADPGGSAGARVEAVEGLGESLVSGQRTPQAWVVAEGQETELPSAPRSALELSRQIEQIEGVPQDIEWASVGTDVWIVQARPITVAADDDGFDSPLDDHLLTTAGIGEMVPGVVPALLWEINRFLLEEAYRSMFDDLGILPGGTDLPFVRRVRGRMAIDFDRLRAVASAIPGAVQELEIDYFGEVDAAATPQGSASRKTSLRRRFLTSFERQARSARSRQRTVGQADVVVETMALLWPRRPVLSSMAPTELLEYAARLIDLAARGLAAELGVAAAASSAFDRLEQQLQGYLGPETGTLRSQEVIAGIGLDRHRDPEASAAIFGGPTWRELERVSQPNPAADMAVATRPDHADRVAALGKELASLPGWKRTRVLTGQVIDVRRAVVRQHIDEVVAQLQRREETKAAILQCGGEVRRVHRHLGTRLHTAGLIEKVDDVELLTTAELANAAVGEPTVGQEVLRRRRRWIDRYDTEGVLPLRFVGVPDRTPVLVPDGDQLEGWGASPGRGRGRAQVVSAPNDEFESGSVLVAEATDASWSPLFLRASAIVVERGGPLSHAAILARELGLPAVLNVAGACRALDGHRLLVDGSTGVVVIEPRETLG